MDIIHRVRCFIEQIADDIDVDGEGVRSILHSVVAAYDKPHSYGRALAAMQMGKCVQSDDGRYTLRIHNDFMERYLPVGAGAWIHICKLPTDAMLFCKWQLVPNPEHTS